MARKKEYPARRGDRCPAHPGALLAELIELNGLTVKSVAEHIGVSRQLLHRIIGETATVTSEMAVRLTAYFGGGAEVWTGMQSAHDLWHAERTLAEDVKRIQGKAPRAA